MNEYLFLLFGKGGISLVLQIVTLIAAVALSFLLLPWWLPTVFWPAIGWAAWAQSNINAARDNQAK